MIRALGIALCISIAIAGCKTSATRSAARNVDEVETATAPLETADDLLSRGSGFSATEAASVVLEKCNAEVNPCSENAVRKHVGCKAAKDGGPIFSAMLEGNACQSRQNIRAQICAAGLDPAAFETRCYTLAKNDSGQTPNAVLKEQPSTQMPACKPAGEAYECSEVGDAKAAGCVATNRTTGLKVAHFGADNNSCNLAALRTTFCSEIKQDTAEFDVICYRK